MRLAGTAWSVERRRFEHPLDGLCTCASLVSPGQHISGNDLEDVWVVIALLEVHAVSDFKAQRTQQLRGDRYLANTGDLYRSARHGHVHDLNKFNSL